MRQRAAHHAILCSDSLWVAEVLRGEKYMIQHVFRLDETPPPVCSPLDETLSFCVSDSAVEIRLRPQDASDAASWVADISAALKSIAGSSRIPTNAAGSLPRPMDADGAVTVGYHTVGYPPLLWTTADSLLLPRLRTTTTTTTYSIYSSNYLILPLTRSAPALVSPSASSRLGQTCLIW